MKNITAAIAAVTFMGLLAFQTQQQAPKKYKVELTIDQWSNMVNGIDAVKSRIKLSDLPSKEVTYINDSLFTPMQNEIVRQVQAQLAAENKKDTSKPKK